MASVTPEVNLRDHITCMPPPSVNKDALYVFETQKSPEVQNRAISSPTKILKTCIY